MTAPSAPAQRPFAAGRPLFLGFATLAVLGAGLFGWGAFASISGAVIAPGRIEVATREQVVEHIDGGTVSTILVRNGDRVTAGDVLIRLDDTLLASEEAILAATHAELVARRNRLEAEYRGADAIVWDDVVAGRAAAEPAVRTILDGQQRLFAARRASRTALEAQLRKRIVQAGKQVASLEAQAGAVRRQSTLVNRELEAERQIFEDGLRELHRVLALEREAAELDGQAGDIEARTAGARSRIAEIEIQILQIGTELAEEAETQAREAQARENEVREKLFSLRARLERMEVRAPVSGEVFDMQVFTPREVVRPGEPMLKIVPQGTELVVRAQLDPIHVDQVWPGQETALLFSAFSARTTPQFEGHILRVSGDAAFDERTGLSWYEVEVALGAALKPKAEIPLVTWARSAWQGIAQRLPEVPESWHPERRGSPDGTPANGGDPSLEDAAGDGGAATAPAGPAAGAAPVAHARDLALAPGMPVEVHMRTGERSPLSYLAKPLTDYFSRSLRED